MADLLNGLSRTSWSWRFRRRRAQGNVPQADGVPFFLIGLALGELFLFLCISPCTVGTMTCVASNLRGQANAVSLFFSYALGGFLSPTIIGGVFDLLNRK